MATQDDFIRTALRVPPDLHARIHAAASVANRTFNAEIVNRLESSFNMPTPANATDTERLEEVIEATIDRTIDAVVRGRIARITLRREPMAPLPDTGRTQNRTILIGNIGRTPEIDVTPKPATNKGPVRRVRNKPADQ